MATDQATLEWLNREYIRSVSEADVRWFDANLAEDFVNSNPDCSLLDRAAFLAHIGRGFHRAADVPGFGFGGGN